jgi:hypothetical protein
MTYANINQAEFPSEYLPDAVEDPVVRALAKSLLAAWFPSSYPVGDDARNWGSIACEDVEHVLDSLPRVLDQLGDLEEDEL